MNDTITSSVIMALLFVARCLIPLSILLGVSYLLRRFKLVADSSDEVFDETDDNMSESSIAPEPTVANLKKNQVSKKKTSGGKKIPATSKKKES